MKKSVVLALMLAASTAFAQTKQTPKASPASDALIQAAKELQAEQKNYNDGFQQAKTTLDASQKQINDQLQAKSKDLSEKLKADKKYKPMLDEIEALQKQLASVGQDAQTKFNQRYGTAQTKLTTDGSIVTTLTPVVRKENDWPDTATFDPATQTWTVPDTAKK